jgi:ComF family protein
MYLDFLNKILIFPQKVFLSIFTNHDTRLQKLRDLRLEDWQTLAHPILHNDNTLSLFNYNNQMIRDALFNIKNKKERQVLTQMSQILVDTLLEDLADRELLENFTNPILVSIPSSRQHILQRGYNPSDIIAEEISSLSNLPYISNVILKSKHTPEQKILSRYARLRNVKHSMSINPKLKNEICGKCIIVIDDIMTTGATIKEAKRVLLKSGARKVMGVVLAH